MGLGFELSQSKFQFLEIRLVLIQGNESKVIDGAKSSDIKHLTDMTASSQDGKLETQDVVSEAHNEGSE